MLCQVGDRVVVDRRREGEIFLNRERYTLAHEYQSIYGVIHPGWRCIHCYCKNYSGQPCECGRKAGDPLTYDHPDSFEPAYDRILLAPVQSGTWKPGMPTPETMCPRCTFSTGGGPHLCRESDCPMRTKALIAAPENARPGQFREGIVRAVGCGARYADGKCYPPQVKPGDRVVFIGHYAPTESHHIAEEITLFGEDLLIMREKQILAVIGS
jgi:co-chaperonin GroES (HSP10)